MKTTNNMITMKTIYILAAFLGLQYNTIFAAGNFSEASPSITSATLTTISSVLAPVVPKEAIFEEIADLKDEAPANESNISLLAPVTPVVADFEDEPFYNTEIIVRALAPITPIDADFEDHI